MDTVTKYNVYVHGELKASYDGQSPATTYAKRIQRRYQGAVVEVSEEIYSRVSSRLVRTVLNGSIFKCSS